MIRGGDYFKLGLFVIGGVALLLVVLIALGAGKLFQRTYQMETYINESVNGLEVGSPVKFRGVRVGSVSEIGFISGKYGKQAEGYRYVYVLCTLDHDLFGTMYEADTSWEGFEWMDFRDWRNSVIAFARKAPGRESVLFVFNFTPVVREGYAVRCPGPGWWREVLNTDAEIYGGSNVGNAGGRQAEPRGDGWFLTLTLPPLAVVAFSRADEGR